MKDINTLVDDIQKLVQTKGWFTDELAGEYGDSVSKRIQSQFSEKSNTPTLRLSQMGPRCPKALWHSIHTPKLAEELPAWAEIKFAFGHMIEALAIVLAKAAGHEVTGEQDELNLDGIKGHRDCIIDGCIVDVKSTSSRGFIKFKNKTIGQDDPFGYLDQLDGYVVASSNDPLVRVKDRGYLLAIDKQLGHVALYEHSIQPDRIRARIKYYKKLVEQPVPPVCECGTVAEGKSGNIKLDLTASYSPYKHCCFPGLRTFIYSTGPMYLTTVKKVPDVPERFITRVMEPISI